MFFDKVKSLAAEKGMSYNKLEMEAGLTRNSIYKWASNTPSVDKVAAVAKVLGVTIDELMKEDA